MKDLFYTIMGLSICLRIDYIPTCENLADPGSREIDVSDSMLSKNAWEKNSIFLWRAIGSCLKPDGS